MTRTSVRDVASDVEEGCNVHEWWQKSWSTRLNNAWASRITIMQRLHSDDLASRIIEDGAAVLEIPMEYRRFGHEAVASVGDVVRLDAC